MVKLIWKLSCNLVYHVFSLKTPDNLQTDFYHEISIKSITLQEPHPALCLCDILEGVQYTRGYHEYTRGLS